MSEEKAGWHEWSKRTEGGVKLCLRPECTWQMLSRPNSNRYRSGPTRPWMCKPKNCEGARLVPHPAAGIMTWPKEGT